MSFFEGMVTSIIIISSVLSFLYIYLVIDGYNIIIADSNYSVIFHSPPFAGRRVNERITFSFSIK